VVCRDVEVVCDGVRAVGEGERDVDIRTGARDEIAELAGAANRMAGQLAEREAERDAADGARRDLIAAVSHDLRTPLTSLRLLAGAIEDDLVVPVEGTHPVRELGSIRNPYDKRPPRPPFTRSETPLGVVFAVRG